MSNEYYKHYQLMEYFVSNYDYGAFYIKGLKKENEIWIVNKNNPNYQIIRISNQSLIKDDDKKRISIYSTVIKQRLHIINPRFLDIRICKDIVTDVDPYDSICIDVNYFNGVNLNNIYKNIDLVLHEVNDEEAEINRLINIINIKFSKEAKKKKNPFSFFKPNSNLLITKIIICLATIMFVAFEMIRVNYSDTSTLIFLGADYKMFTLGLGEYWRLFTGAFLHASLIHLLCNMLSLFTIGSLIEPKLGKTKYSLLFICGVIGSSLTHGVLSGNSLVIGLSGGIYALLAYLIAYLIKTNLQSVGQIIPAIMFNIFLNFLPNVSWQSHLGGAIVGLIFFYIFENDKINYYQIPLIIILFIGLFYKYYDDHMIEPFYGLTDMEVVEIASDYKFSKYANNISNKLYKIYLGDKGE